MEKLDPQLQKLVDSPSYRVAFRDPDFLGREELRPLRMQLELLKPEMAFQEHGIENLVVVFGGTQIIPCDEAKQQVADCEVAVAADSSDKKAARELERAKRRLAKCQFYDHAREFGKLVSTSCFTEGKCDYYIVTGGGPGIMEAANRGAHEVEAKSVGLNITLPHEQAPNRYITPELCFQFHYFAMRKMHFLLRAKALVIFPGGFGTLDELFCALTLRQVHRMQDIPIILFGKEYWSNVINFKFLADEGVIRDEHLDLIDFAETPEEAWSIIEKHHADS